MAGNERSGRALTFRMSEKELEKKINEYKRLVESGERTAPCWPDFREFLGYLQEDLDEVVNQGIELKGAYYTRALMLKSMGATCENYVLTHPHWRTPATAPIAKLLLAQGYGWTRKYTSVEKGAGGGNSKFEIHFGGSDKRSKQASK